MPVVDERTTKKKYSNLSIRLPGNVADSAVQKSAAKRGWSRNHFIKIAVGEKLMRDGAITSAEFRQLFKCNFEDVASRDS